MITIKKSETADTRTCDFANTSKETLLASSRQHIGDVVKALAFFSSKITEAAGEHDYDKLTAIDWFHADFVTGFKETGWWDNHRRIHRHHIDKPDGVPENVNLLDVLEHIADCVMAGMARSGSVYELKLSDDLLQTAFKNTVELLKSQVRVVSDDEQRHAANLYQDRCENAYVEVSAYDALRQALSEANPSHSALSGAPPAYGVWTKLSEDNARLRAKVQELEGRIGNALL
jgi:hypothetical protein